MNILEFIISCYLIGPYIVYMGYVAVIFGFMFGIVNTSSVILLFIATILFVIAFKVIFIN